MVNINQRIITGQYQPSNNHISPQITVHRNDHDIWHMHNADRNSLRQSHTSSDMSFWTPLFLNEYT